MKLTIRRVPTDTKYNEIYKRSFFVGCFELILNIHQDERKEVKI